MAWPKLRNRKSPVPASTFSDDQTVPDGTRSQVAPSDSKPTWRAHQGWPDANPTVTPRPAETADTADTDSGDAPFWEGWAPADEPAGLDDPGDGLPEGGPEDDGVTDVDPRPRPAAEPVVTAVGDAREQPKAEGIGQHLGNMAHLSGNPRMRIWRRRVIVAVIAGLAIGIWLHNWKWGLTFFVLGAIADTVVRSRTSFNGPAGVRLTRAQKSTVRQLSSLERKGYRAMHCVPLPGSDEQVDHLVIGPAGVFSIDSEDWDKRLPVRTSSHRNLWHGPHNMKDRLEHSRWEAQQVSDLLSAAMGSPVTVRPAMAVYGPKIMWDVAEIRDVDTFSGPRLRKYLRRRAKRRGVHLLSPSEVERIDKAAHLAFPQAPRTDSASR